MSGQTETGWVIVLYDDVGVLSYWTGQEAWAFSINNEDAVRFARQQDANTVMDCIVKESDGALLHLDRYTNDKLRVEEHMWCNSPTHADIDHFQDLMHQAHGDGLKVGLAEEHF